MKTIPVGKRGHFTMVDDEDYERLSSVRWSPLKAPNTYYATRQSGGKFVYMHNEILGKPPAGFVTDYVDRNGLNNQKYNLRFATKSQNGHNKRATGRSGLKGVCSTRSKLKPWEAEIMYLGKTIRLGRFRTALEAKEAYNKKGLELYGSYFSP